MDISKVNAISKSDAKVLIQLGDCNAKIDVDAASLSLCKGNGDLDLDVELSDDLFVSTGNGNNDIDGLVGDSFTMLAGNGNQNVDMIAGGAAIIQFGDGNADLTVTADSITTKMGNGDLVTNFDAVNDVVVSAKDGVHDVAAIAGGDIKAIVGDGKSYMYLTAGDDIVNQVGNGDSILNYNAGGNLVAITGESGKATVDAEVGENAIILTYDGDDTIDANVGGMAYINAGSSDNDCESDNDIVKLTAGENNSSYQKLLASVFGEENAKSIGNMNVVSLGNNDDTAAIIADNVFLQKNTGELLAGIIGDTAQISSKASENDIAGYGDHYTMNVLASADNDIRTMDFAIRDGKDDKKIVSVDEKGTVTKTALKDTVTVKDGDKVVTLNAYDEANNLDNVNWFKENFTEAFEAETWDISSSKREVVYERIDITGMSKDEIAKKYNLSNEEKAVLENVDLTETFGTGKNQQPKYSIARSPKKSAKAGKDVYVVVRTDSCNSGYIHARAVSDNECIAFNIDSSIQVEEYSGVQTTTTKYEGLDNYLTTGVRDWTIMASGESSEESSLMANISAYGLTTDDDSVYDIKILAPGMDSDDTSINVKGSHIDSIEWDAETVETKGWATKVYVQRASWNSPLILDMNGDNKISTADGIGVDTDGDGKVDGAAADGDKMLAMSDLNGNNKIDAAEVFGNNTVSPFTGKKLNAANGFEALKMIAEEAEEKGYKCINNGEVDMAALAKALETVGVKLGFISDENNTTLEELSGVATISTLYKDTLYEDGEQRQFGSFTTTDGKIRRVDDVWFQ